MDKIDFWDRVKHGCDKLAIPAATFHVWKHRGRVASKQAIPLYRSLAGTDHEITLDEIEKHQ